MSQLRLNGTLSLQVADCFHIMQERYFLQQNSVLRKNKSVFSSTSRGTGGYGSKHTERILSSKKKTISKRSLPKSLSGKRKAGKAGKAVKERRRNEIKRTKLRNDAPSYRHGHALERSKKVSRQVPATSIRNRPSNNPLRKRKYNPKDDVMSNLIEKKRKRQANIAAVHNLSGHDTFEKKKQIAVPLSKPSFLFWSVHGHTNLDIFEILQQDPENMAPRSTKSIYPHTNTTNVVHERVTLPSLSSDSPLEKSWSEQEDRQLLVALFEWMVLNKNKSTSPQCTTTKRQFYYCFSDETTI